MKISAVLIVLILMTLPVRAFELDTSVDEEIRKNYNPSALENSLPALPKTSPTANTSSSKSPDNYQKQTVVKTLPSNPNFDKSTAIRIKKGTKFKVKSGSYLSDTTGIGTRVSFTTLQPVSQRYFTIPAGTVFNAAVTDSHPPQITGNGGLLEITIDGINYGGYSYGANGKITKANHKKVFLNSIKGKRGYWKGVAKQVDKGENFYKKTRNISSKLSNNPIGMIVASVPTIVGTGVYAVNLVGSPIFSIGSKGSKLSIPAGSEFEIKLKEDIYLQR